MNSDTMNDIVDLLKILTIYIMEMPTRIYEPTKRMFSNALPLLSSIRLVYDNGNTMRLAKRRKNALLKAPFKKPK